MQIDRIEPGENDLEIEQEKLKSILKEAYSDIRLTQSKIIEKLNQVKCLTEKTDKLKSQLCIGYGEKTDLTVVPAAPRSPNDKLKEIVFFNNLLLAQEDIDMLLMDSFYEIKSTTCVIDSIKHKLATDQDQDEHSCLKKTTASKTKMYDHEEEYFSLDSSFKDDFINSQYGSLCSLEDDDDYSSEYSSGIHSAISNSNSKSLEDLTNDDIDLLSRYSPLAFYESANDTTSPGYDYLDKTIHDSDCFLLDNSSPREVIQTKKKCEKFREVNLFSSLFVLFVYFDLRVFLFFIWIFKCIKGFMLKLLTLKKVI
jgi:hypothetical protein